MKKNFLTALLLFTTVLCASAYANRDKGYGGERQGPDSKDAAAHVGMKSDWLLREQQELGLSDAQVQKIRELSLKSQKDAVQAQAEMESINLDIRSKMREENLDQAALGKLIDQKYESRKAYEKRAISSMAEIKSILTPEQKEKLKALKKERQEKFKKN